MIAERVTRCLTALSVLCASGCKVSGGTPPVVVRDSAGVTIVESAVPAWAAGDGWTLSPAPAIELVSDPADEGFLLHEVTGLTVLPDGRVAVANMGDNSVRLYDPSGNPIWKAGRSGDGPDEFRQIRGLLRRGDELWALQVLPNPLKVFDLGGRFLRSVPPPSIEGLPIPRLQGLFEDGSWLISDRPRGTPAGRMWNEFSTFMRISQDVIDTVAVLPMVRTVDILGMRPEQQALSPYLRVMVTRDRIYEGFPSAWDVGVRDRSGEVILRIRRAWDPVAVTAAHRDAYRQAFMEWAEDEPRLQEALRQLADGMIYPDYHPAHGDLQVDATGALWVERTQTEPPWSEGADYVPVPPRETVWDVFDSEGTWLGPVEFPARFRVLEIGSDYVAGVWKDELDLQRVRVYDLLKSVR